MANVSRRAGQCVLGGLVAVMLAGCGISSYQVQFVPQAEKLAGKPPVQIFVYFAPEQDVERCESWTAARLFADSAAYEGQLNARMLRSAVVSADQPARVSGEGLPDAVAKVFVWGNFSESVEGDAGRLKILPDVFQKPWFLSREGLIQIPVTPAGFGVPR
jgi:hypothetical protein